MEETTRRKFIKSEIPTFIFLIDESWKKQKDELQQQSQKIPDILKQTFDIEILKESQKRFGFFVECIIKKSSQ